ncbi:MAG: plasmid pRiA4b ORF-3 family protein [Steroidobacteraceae bacterium]
MARRPAASAGTLARRVGSLYAVRYQLRIELKDIKPAIWRRILVPENLTLAKLHPILLWSMGWQGGHLHEYEIARLRYGPPPEDDWPNSEPIHDERRFRLNRFVDTGLRRFKYLYDFGDHWEHLIAVEDIHPRTDGTQAVVCVAGENACPPEDVGGPPGYFEFLAAIKDPTHEEHANLLRWIGGAFDPTAFDLAEVNARLADIKA